MKHRREQSRATLGGLFYLFLYGIKALFQRESQIATARLLVNLSRASKSILSP